MVIPSNGDARELSGGFRKTTNNRMELLACIVGLEQFNTPSAVALYSDSRYVVDGITKGWAKKWQRNGWRKSNGEPALNIDLWERLLSLCDRHDVRFIWVKGHAGNAGNERCDQLATQAAAQSTLPADTGYEGDSKTATKKQDADVWTQEKKGTSTAGRPGKPSTGMDEKRVFINDNGPRYIHLARLVTKVSSGI